MLELGREELDKLMADLLERPTIAAAGEDEGHAATRFYRPAD